MSLDYISEAFRSLESLNEEMFSTDAKSIDELSDFITSDDVEEKISIIDMDAETEEDLQDTYVGKIICDCNVCHSHVFKDKDQITIDADGIVDIDDDCPYCGEHNGFVIIGEISEFNPNAEAEEEAEEEEKEEVLEESLNESGVTLWDTLVRAYPELEEPLNESFNNVSIETDDQRMTMTSDKSGKVTVTTEPMNNSELDDDVSGLIDSPESSFNSGDEVISPISDEDADSIIGSSAVTAEDTSSSEEESSDQAVAEEESTEEESTEETPGDEPTEEDAEESESTNESYLVERLLEDDNDEDAAKPASGTGPEAVVDKLRDADYEDFVKILSKDGKSQAFLKYLQQHYKKGDDAIGTIKAANPTTSVISCAKLHPTQKNISVSKSFEMFTTSPDWAVDIVNNPEKAFRDPTVTYGGQYIIDGHHRWSKAYALNGDCNIEVLDFPQISGVTWEDMLKAVQLAIVTTNPNAELINKVGDDNMLASGGEKAAAKLYVETVPESVVAAMKAKGRGNTKEEQAKTIANNVLEMRKTSAPVSGAASRTYMPQMNTKTKADEKQIRQQGIIDMTESIDFEFDDLDEKSMDELGESYLKRVYENVNSFKTTSVSTYNNKLIIEGMINFKSGASKKTGFIFEAKEATKDGAVKFIGENAHFCRGKRAFTLAGSVSGNKLIVESLTYNYRAKTANGKSTRVYGKVDRSK